MVYKTTPSAHISLALPEYGAPKEYEKLLLIHNTKPQGSSSGEPTNITRKTCFLLLKPVDRDTPTFFRRPRVRFAVLTWYT